MTEEEIWYLPFFFFGIVVYAPPKHLLLNVFLLRL